MKKPVLIIITLISVLLLSWFIIYKVKTSQGDEEDTFSTLFKTIIKNNAGLTNKTYYYFSAWNTKCKPCIEEMPRLDMIADSLSKSIGFVYVSDDSEETISRFIAGKNMTSRNFIFLNDMDDLISAVYDSKSCIGKPTLLIL